ncbi:uncharacterized protein LOC129580071 [Sitodiplosis mosellana]|uniref:uncharacterized protein LOC129580071 n=1 Tax=Sitodiplosis mosellana TaxID=263140 RepID=UPI002443A026|nr:uncharacterized protein LOC129580071 [Sitodiplosis mosellana]
MDNRNEAADRKRQPEGANPPANKRSKTSETVSADVQRASNKTAQQPTKIHYTRLRRRMDEEEEEKLAKLGPDPNLCTTKLTDVNVDCLEHIFKNLRLIDLLNVADSNKQLKPAADLVFASRYGKQWIFIHSRYKSILIERNMCPTTVQIPRSFRLKLLRCFGHLITKLDITHDKHMDAYVNEYCADSLVEIKFQRCKASTLDDLRKPFTQVRTLCFDSCKLGSKLSELDKWFPEVRRLEFNHQNESDCNETAVHLPKLRHLSLFLPADEKNHLNKKYFEELLRLNPNIRTLDIGGHFDAKYLQNVSKYLQRLESLKFSSIQHLSDIGNGTVRFPNVKRLHLWGTALDHSLTNFISQHKKLTKLTFSSIGHCEEGALLKITSPALVEVDFGNFHFPSDEVASFVAECPSLKKLTVAFGNENDYEAFQKWLGNEWREIKKYSYYHICRVTIER